MPLIGLSRIRLFFSFFFFSSASSPQTKKTWLCARSLAANQDVSAFLSRRTLSEYKNLKISWSRQFFWFENVDCRILKLWNCKRAGRLSEVPKPITCGHFLTDVFTILENIHIIDGSYVAKKSQSADFVTLNLWNVRSGWYKCVWPPLRFNQPYCVMSSSSSSSLFTQ